MPYGTIGLPPIHIISNVHLFIHTWHIHMHPCYPYILGQFIWSGMSIRLDYIIKVRVGPWVSPISPWATLVLGQSKKKFHVYFLYIYLYFNSTKNGACLLVNNIHLSSNMKGNGFNICAHHSKSFSFFFNYLFCVVSITKIIVITLCLSLKLTHLWKFTFFS